MKRLIALFFFLLLLASPANATISTVENQLTVGGNNTQTVFNFSFVGDQSTDFNLIYTNSSGQQTTIPPSQYTVALNPIEPGSLWGVGGFVTYPLMGSPIANGTTLTIQRLIPLQQLVSISGQGDFNPQSVEQAIDIIEMQTQQVSSRTGQLRGTWASSVMYNYGDMVVDGAAGADTNNIYLCTVANTSNVWATDLSNGEWSLALNVQSIVNSLPQIGNNQVFGNISGSMSTPTGIGLSAMIDSAIGSTQGDILYRSGSAWSVLSPGTSGQVLTTQGTAANPQWSNSTGTGSVTSVGSGTGLTGGPITTSGTLSLATIANNSLLANTSGSTAAPGATTLSAFMDSVFGNTQGAILYRGGSVWSALGPGSSGQFLQTQGSAANPQWATVSGGVSSIANPGYSTFLGGLIQQWGTASSVTGNGSSTVTLPLTFPNNFWNIQITANTNNSGTQSSNSAVISSTSQFVINNNNSTATTFSWFAIGN